MYGKIIKNDIRKSRLITVTIAVFILAAASLTSLAAMLAVNLSGAIDNMLKEAKTIHFMHMHVGEIDREALSRFAGTHDNAEDFQVLEFLNIEGAEIIIGENTLASSVQDNGLSTQSKNFDFLLDLEGGIISPAEGEMYVPLYYMNDGTARLGDKATIHGVTFTVAGFLRDSTMNAALAQSKRFLVHENDFEKIRRFGIIEYLVEFRLKDPSATAAFESDYLAAGLPSNGPMALTYPLVKMMNGITDGMMIAVLALISILVIIVAFLCIRFTLLAKIEEDYREIGVLKAVGLRLSRIKKLYMVKYGAIAAIAGIFGFLFSVFLRGPFTANIRLYMGESGNPFTEIFFGLAGTALIFLAVTLYVNAVLRRFGKISAAEAIRFGAPQEKPKPARRFLLNQQPRRKQRGMLFLLRYLYSGFNTFNRPKGRGIKPFNTNKNRLFSTNVFLGIKDVLARKKLYATMFLVIVISFFIMVVPRNIYNTISSKNFITYMGVGVCDVFIGITRAQTERIRERTAEVSAVLAEDNDISKYTVITSMIFDMLADGGAIEKFKVDLGDHSIFPIAYSKGGPPRTETEIAISSMYAADFKKDSGDEIILLVDGEKKRLTVCGIYSDLTNAGKTAKAIFKTNRDDISGSAIWAAFAEGVAADEKIRRLREGFPFTKVSGVDEHIRQMLGSTSSAIQKASYASIAAAVILATLITLLFMKMLAAKDRYGSAVLKSLGFTSRDIKRQYVVRSAVVLLPGVVIGTVLANTLGELAGTALISSFGASTFKFEVNPLFAYVFSPLLIAACVYAATFLGVSDIRALKVSEHIKEA